jgi:hypothetical protein
LPTLHPQLQVFLGGTVSRLRPLVAGTLIAAAGLIGVNGIAYAATGSNIILGHNNHANKVTKITRTTAGPALALKVKSHQVPFTVNSTKQVAKLNASYVDGLSAASLRASLQTHALVYNLPLSATTTSSNTYPLVGLPAGSYDVNFDVVGHMSAAGDDLNCVVETSDSFAIQILGYGSAYANFSTASASGLVTVSAAHPLQMRCFTSAGTYTLVNGSPALVAFTKIDSVAIHGAAAAIAHTRGAAQRAASGR